MSLLEIDKMSMQFGGLKAIRDVTLNVERGELVGIIGPNGAGKTTIFNVISGIYNPTTGKVVFDGKDITKYKPYDVATQGVSRTFQNIRLFKSLTVLENVRIALHPFIIYSMADSIFNNKRYRTGEIEITREALNILSTLNLQSRANEIARNLPYGEQRRLEIARALASKPKLLLLDEPAAGMNPTETQNLMELICFIKEKFDLTILLIEHQMKVIMGICRRIVVIDFGEIIAEGTPKQIQNDSQVVEAYLGKKARPNVIENR